VLRDGRIVISGGLEGDGSGPGTVLASAYVFDPETGASTPLAAMQQPRIRHVMVELRDGRVLVVGGEDPRSEDAPGSFTTVEAYDLHTGMPTAVDEIRMSPGWGPLWPHVALLDDGRVVISGRIDIEEPCGALPAPSGSPAGFPSIHAIVRLRTHVFDPGTGRLREGPLVPSSWPGLVPIGGDRVLLSSEQRAYASCALDAEAVVFPWLGIVDFGLDTIFESRNPVTGAGTIDAAPDVVYAGGVRLADGRVAVIEASRETPQPFRIDVLTIE
jgi:hypothetical protein